MKISIFNILLILLTFVAKIYSSADITPVSISYKIEDGLPSNELYFSLQDLKGNMWFSSDFGLIKYDGYKFKTYGRKHGLKEISVFFLQETSDGKIWMNTLSGDFYYYDPSLDIIITYPYNKIHDEYHRQIDVYRFHVDDNGTLYFPWKNMIVSISKNGKIEEISASEATTILLKIFDQDKALSTPVYRKYEDSIRINEKYIQHISILDSRSRSFDITYKGSDYFYSRYNNLVLKDNTLLIAAEHNMLFIIKNDSIIGKNFNSSIHSMTEDPSSNRIYLCMGDNDGVLMYESINDLIEDRYEVIAQNKITTHLTIDNCNGLWITTTKHGIIYIPDLTSEIIAKNVFEDNDKIVFLEQDNDDNLYLSSKNGNIAQYNLLDNISEIIYKGEGKIRSLFLDIEENKLWFFTYEKTYIYDIINKQTISLAILPESINKFDGENLILNSSKKIYIINRKDYSFKKVFSFPNMTDIRLFSTSILKDSTIYVGMINGSYILKKDSLIKFNKEITCLSERIQEINQLSDESLVYRVRGCGIVIESPSGFYYIDTEEGLLSNEITKIYIDKHDNIWTCSRKGLNKIQFLSNGSFKLYSYTTNNGLPSNNIYDISLSRNKLYISTAKGLVQLDKNQSTYCLSNPRITSVSCNNINYTISKTDKLKLKYDNNNLDIEFISVDFTQFGLVKYRYRIKSKNIWKETHQTNVHLSSLEFGMYNFEVQSSTSNGHWSTSSFFPFVISRPWWNTVLFKNLMVFIILLISYLIYKYKTYRIKKEHQYRLKINDVENKFLRAQINPHFIFNALNSISYYISKNEKEKANSFLRDFSALIRFNLNATKRKLVPISEEIRALESLLILESQRFPNKFNYQISLDDNIDGKLTMIPPMLLQPIIENALIHGIFQLKDRVGNIKIDFLNISKDFYICTIIDNGIGFENTKTKRKDFNKMSGIGIQNVKDRIHIINDSPNNIYIELEFLNGPKGIGTKVEFRFEMNI